MKDRGNPQPSFTRKPVTANAPGVGITLHPKRDFLSPGQSCWEHVLIHLAAAKPTNVDVMFVKELQPKVAQRCWLLKYLVILMAIAAAGDDGWEVIACVVG